MFKRILLTFSLLLGSGCPLSLRAETSRAVDPYDLEAAYLVHFLEFVDWPAGTFADPKAPFVIGILGEDPFGNRLAHLTEGRLINQRPVVLKHFGRFDPGDEDTLKTCHILFVAESEKGRLSTILKLVRRAPVLTVSEIEKFPLFGGILGFDQEGRKIHLSLNPKAAKSAQLKVSARLAQVCKTYRED